MVADRFLELISEGQAAAAWDLTTPDFEAYSVAIRSSPPSAKGMCPAARCILLPCEWLPSTTVHAAESHATTDVAVAVRLLAEDQNGTWRIDRMHVE